MEMKVMIPSPAVDFNFDNACNSPYLCAPSSPQRFGNYFFSAPTSPTCASSFFRGFHDHFAVDTTGEEIPGISNLKDAANTNDDEDADFAFDFSGQLGGPSVFAEELFDGGKIKPLELPRRLQHGESRISKSPKSPKRLFKEALSPRKKKKDSDTFSATIQQTGRERTYNSSNSDILLQVETNQQSTKQSPSSTWYKKWKLKDLLFRNASARSKDPLKNDALLKKNDNEDVKSSSFRYSGSANSVAIRRRKVSAHELHYRVNRVVSEEMRRKSFLPYKNVLLGC